MIRDDGAKVSSKRRTQVRQTFCELKTGFRRARMKPNLTAYPKGEVHMNLRVLCVVLVVVLSFGLPSGLFADALVSVGSGTVAIGNILNIPVSISGVSDLYAFQFDLSFDAAVLDLLGISEGAFLPTAGVTFFSPGAIDNLAGTATFTADSLVGSVPGASGTGDLASFEFRAISFGSGDLTLSNVILLDSSLNDIAFTAQPGRSTSCPNRQPCRWRGRSSAPCFWSYSEEGTAQASSSVGSRIERVSKFGDGSLQGLERRSGKNRGKNREEQGRTRPSRLCSRHPYLAFQNSN